MSELYVSPKNMKTTILTLIKDRQHVSFNELTLSIPGFSGDLAMIHGDDPNIILWHALSEEAFKTLTSLLDDGQIFIHPTNAILYSIDGGTLDLPTVKRPPSKGYKSPHWYPVTFCDHPFDPNKINQG